MLTEAGRKLGLDLRQGGVETLAGETFDVIVLSHVVEHFRDPVAEVGRAAALLNPGGALYIEVPDIGGLAFCLGALQLPHLYYFTPATLSHYLAPLGLKPVATGAIAGVSFHSVFVRDPNPPQVSLAGEYRRMQRTIRRFERREALKGRLRGLGLLSIARSLVRLAR
jgi:SAM-dependent methyltransferase